MMLTDTFPFSGFVCSRQRWRCLSRFPDDDDDDTDDTDDDDDDDDDTDNDDTDDTDDDDEIHLCSFSTLWLCVLDLRWAEEASVLDIVRIEQNDQKSDQHPH